jgi:hypothetical protein
MINAYVSNQLLFVSQLGAFSLPLTLRISVQRALLYDYGLNFVALSYLKQAPWVAYVLWSSDQWPDTSIDIADLENEPNVKPPDPLGC